MKKRVMHSKKKSQIATEYLVIIGLVIAVLMPAGYLLFTYEGSSSDSIKAAKIEGAANEIVSAANNLYNYGSQSKTKADVTIPEGVESIEFSGNEIIFNYMTSSGNTNELAKAADTNIVGDIIVNPVPGVLGLDLINLNIRICVSLEGIPCEACPGVLICENPYYCDPVSDQVCPNEYLPTGFTPTCGTNTTENCYDQDCDPSFMP